MNGILAEILQLGGSLLQSTPEILQIVENAIGAFKANDQAGLDTSHPAALALANTLSPANTVPLT
jgi:hypothetical protein